MDHRNIFAHTDPSQGSYPEYISINERDGRVQITVRGPRAGDREGPTATMALPREKVPELSAALRELHSVNSLADCIRALKSDSPAVADGWNEAIEAAAGIAEQDALRRINRDMR